MAFIQHHPCPRCNSKDNLAEYDNGFFCFGCGYKNLKRDLSLFKPRNTVKVRDDINLDKNLPKTALKWLLKYNLTEKEMEQFYYSHERVIKNEKRHCNLLVLYADSNYWLARNLDDGAYSKYVSSGNKPIIKYGTGQTLVFVEDIISAIKVGRQFTAIPMLGSKVSQDMWTEAKNYDKVIVWGDRDKATSNVTSCRRAREVLGKEVRCIITEKDPKDYSDTEIYNYII